MEVSGISDRVSSIAKIQAQSSSKFLLDRQSFHQISAVFRPMDAVAKPPAKPHTVKTARRRALTKRRRTERIPRTEGGGSDDGIFAGFFAGDGPYGGAGVGGGGGGGGGGGDNNGFGEFNWDESSDSTPADPAFDIVYQILCWIVFSNCLHFAIKKIISSMMNEIDGHSVREKVPLRLTPVC